MPSWLINTIWITTLLGVFLRVVEIIFDWPNTAGNSRNSQRRRIGRDADKKKLIKALRKQKSN